MVRDHCLFAPVLTDCCWSRVLFYSDRHNDWLACLWAVHIWNNGEKRWDSWGLMPSAVRLLGFKYGFITFVDIITNSITPQQNWIHRCIFVQCVSVTLNCSVHASTVPELPNWINTFYMRLYIVIYFINKTLHPSLWSVWLDYNRHCYVTITWGDYVIIHRYHH